jgi:hypothetical protein
MENIITIDDQKKSDSQICPKEDRELISRRPYLKLNPHKMLKMETIVINEDESMMVAVA